MKTITLGKTGIVTPQNGFGALPIQRVSDEEAVRILRMAKEGGMTFFDTARAYSDSEHKLGLAFEKDREDIFIATKTTAKDPETFWEHLNTSLSELKTDYIDIYQLHFVQQCYKPGDGSGLYECLLKAKEEGKIRHIGITTHKIGVAEEIVESGLYESLQYPFSYLASDREIELVKKSAKANMCFIAMKGLSGGLITNAKACMAFMLQFDNVIPIWGVQKQDEIAEWLSFFENEPAMDEEMTAMIEADKKELSGNFCRGCGYCMPCPKDITIFQCARMSLMLRRAPSAGWLSENMQAEMKKIEDCINCRSCAKKCPYGLDTPALLKENYEDYKLVLAGKVKV